MRLPIELTVIETDRDGKIVATESGHVFRIPAEVTTDCPTGKTFRLDPEELTTENDDEMRPAMARALINEIIGAPVATTERDVEKIHKIG